MNISYTSRVQLNKNIINRVTQNSKANMKHLVSFGYESPLRDVAKHCAYCGVEMLSNNEFSQLTTKIFNSNGVELQTSLQDIHNRFLYSEKFTAAKTIKELIESAKVTPEKKGEEIIKKYLTIKKAEIENRPDRNGKQYLDRVRRIAPNLPEDIRKHLDNLLNFPPNDLFKVVQIIAQVGSRSEKFGISLPEEFNNICNDAKKEIKLLKSTNVISSDDYSPIRFIKRLISPLNITMEHIHPHSKGGKDGTSNYLAVCSGCNSERENIDFTEALKKHPKIKEFIIKSLKEVKEVIEKLIMPPESLKNYINNVSKALKTESNGMLDITI